MIRRDATRDVWRAVVFAGAMLGCSSPSKPPAEEAPPPETPEPVAAAPDATAAAPSPPDASPPDAAPPDAAPRPRKSSGKPKGRGFLLV